MLLVKDGFKFKNQVLIIGISYCRGMAAFLKSFKYNYREGKNHNRRNCKKKLYKRNWIWRKRIYSNTLGLK
jgi:hypothetical protein